VHKHDKAFVSRKLVDIRRNYLIFPSRKSSEFLQNRLKILQRGRRPEEKGRAVLRDNRQNQWIRRQHGRESSAPLFGGHGGAAKRKPMVKKRGHPAASKSRLFFLPGG